MIEAIGRTCPECKEVVDENRVCWQCENRPCVNGCGHMTGSPFVAWCDVCACGGTYEGFAE